ncbi:MAG: hypothetical protein IPM95_03950 [Sphingobacteriales bacterium]|jgi:hypothetical protein|nr:hypothetical protein [Sphingobacteriales bacterium]
MAETLGMLCDKLTIVKLKQYHTDDGQKTESLNKQAEQLQEEIDEYVENAVRGNIPLEKLTFASNKVFKREGNEVAEVAGGMGAMFSQLAEVNCELWHEVEKGYDIENVPVDQKDKIVKNLAVLNLQRNKCIDAIDRTFLEFIINNKR